jgi:hypothetical protein
MYAHLKRRGFQSMPTDSAAKRQSFVVLVALTAAFFFGAFDQWIGAHNNSFWTQVSLGLSALWLVVPFIAGFLMSNQRKAVVMGLCTTCLSLLAFVLMIVSPFEGTHIGPAPTHLYGTWNQLSFSLLVHAFASQGQWFALAIVAGPVFGLLGYRWRTFRYWAYALPVSLALALEPPARWTMSRIGVGDIPFVPFTWPNNGLAQRAELIEFVLGLVATSLVLRFGAQRRRTATS